MDGNNVFATGFFRTQAVDPSIVFMTPLLTALILALIGMAYPNLIRAAFYPFANGFRRSLLHGISLYFILVVSAYAGILLVVALGSLAGGPGHGPWGW